MAEINNIIGKQTAKLTTPVYVHSYASAVGKKEGQGPLGSYFDIINKDPLWGKESWEMAESAMQLYAIERALKKGSLDRTEIRYLVAGDLLGQLIATTFGIKNLEIPLFGVYGACSTMGESLALASMLISGGFAHIDIAMTSSHFAGAEKQFRFPLDYGNQRPLAATWTVTGAGAVILSDKPAPEHVLEPSKDAQIQIKYVTTGKIVDFGVKDSMNMGACMAPAACNVIEANLSDLAVMPDYYDKIITGDLGYVGRDILLDLLEGKKYDIKDIYMDCGIEMYYNDIQDTHSGGSGCGCSASTLCGYIFGKLRKKEWNRVLFVPTGALLSPVSFNEGESVPGIAHGIVFETCSNIN